MRSINPKSLLLMPLLIGALVLGACGGSSDSQTDSENTSAATPVAQGGMFQDLSEEDIQCLEDQGASLPEPPSGSPPEMPSGTPPEGAPEGGPPAGTTGATGTTGNGGDGGGPPQGMPEGMEELQAAMSECGIEMPTPPAGGPPASENNS